MEVAPYTDRVERARFFADTFGSEHWLWDTPDVFRFEPEGRKPAGAEFRTAAAAAVARLRAADEALRTQREDRHRAEVLRGLIATYLKD